MEKTVKEIEDFELILRNKRNRTPVLYGHDFRDREQASKPRDVIKIVQSQMRAIQKADTNNLTKVDNTTNNYFTKKEFIPVAELPDYPKELHEENIYQFETQFVSDSQLIALVQNAEHPDTKVSTPENITLHHVIAEIGDGNTTDTADNHRGVLSKEDNNDKSSLLNDLEESAESIGVNDETDTVEVNDNIFKSQIFEMDKVEVSETLVAEESRSPSPVLNFKNNKILPLVFDLEKFERFERIAFPIVEENKDLNRVKHLINSQLSDGELNIEIEDNHMFVCLDKKSPILNIEDKIVMPTTALNYLRQKTNSYIQDEILFSSDEESDRMIQDLPLTCPFKTSTYDKNDVLNKSMYVGFQTASNNPIQVSEESFCKAKSILSFEDTDKLNFNEIVEARDGTTNTNKDEDELNRNSENVGILDIDMAINNDDSLKVSGKADSDYVLKPKKRKYDGFITASNKKIQLSNSALLRCKKVFKDIDLNEEFDENSNNGKDKLSNVFHNNESDFNDNADDIVIEKSNYQIKATELNLDCNKSKQSFMEDLESDLNDENIIKEFENVDMTIEINDIVSKYNEKENCHVQDCVNRKNVKNKPMTNHQSNIINSLGSDFVGFKTANNMIIEISKEALRKTNDVFKDIDIGDRITTNSEFIKNKTKNIETPNKFFKNDQLNTDSAEPQKCMTNNTVGISTGNQPLSNTRFVGFKTANDRNITISSHSLIKSKEIFKDIQDLTNEREENTSLDVFKGFKTANNKVVKVSEESLVKTKNIFKDINNENEHQNKLDPVKEFHGSRLSKNFEGFKTANNNVVKISERALSRTKKIFEKIFNASSDDNLNTGNVTPEPDFKRSPKNDKVNVANTSLEKAKIFVKNPRNANIMAEGSTVNRSKSVTKTNYREQIKENVKNIDRDVLRNSSVYPDDLLFAVQEGFNETLYTEDFTISATRSTRSTSPILLCPKAKRLKFEAPHKNLKHTQTTEIIEQKKPLLNFKKDYKKTKTYKLKDLCDLEKRYEEKSVAIDYDMDNLMDFIFEKQRNDVTETVVNVEHVQRMFLSSVNAKLIPKGWLENHIKLILWKLLSYEIKFPNVMANVCTVGNVIDQLKYRYDKELYNAERPALRKILEKDDVPSNTLVLCVAGIFVDGVEVKSVPKTNNIELLVSDGWYSVKATTDRLLARMVRSGKIVVGTKVMTCGAELLNCEGVSPWEDVSSVRLKLSGNSTSRCPWYARLGQHRARPARALRHVDAQGGRVARLRAHVARVYPPLYVEKLGDGTTVTRSERLEQLQQTRLEAARQALAEELQRDVERACCEQESQDVDSQEMSCRRDSDSGSQLYRQMKRSTDPGEFRSDLTASQNHILQQHLDSRRDAVVARLQSEFRARAEGTLARRNVAVVLRVRVLDPGPDCATRGTLSVWNPTEEVLELLQEGNSIEVTNVTPTAVRYSEIQLSAGRQSAFTAFRLKESTAAQFRRRACALDELVRSPAAQTPYGEVDTAGLIVRVEPKTTVLNNTVHFQNVYLSDFERNIVSINFWGGLEKFGYDNLLDTGQVVACVNVQRRAGSTARSIPQYRATEISYFTKSPKIADLKKLVVELNEKFKSCNIQRFCEDCVDVIENKKRKSTRNENVTPYKTSDVNLTKTTSVSTPLTVNKNDFKNLTNESDRESPSPKTLLRRQQIKAKIEKLKRYGEPPPLNPITIVNKTTNAMAAYRSPVNVAGSKKNIDCSSFSDTSSVSKANDKTVVPVKLNFDVSTEEGDPFAEELDPSLPLSLE